MHARFLRLVPPLLTVLLTAVLALSGCTIGGGAATVQGSGHLKSEQRTVSGFNAVTFSGVGQLKIAQTGKESLIVEADDNLLPLLTSTVSAGTLELGIKPNTSIQSATTITFDVTVKALKEIALSGAGNATVNNLNTPALTITVSGAGQLTITGSADSQQATISGVGSYDGSGFATKTAKVSISGTGNAVVQVSDSLDAEVSGVGSVEYIGNPRVTQQITGLGSVRQR